MLNMEKVLKKNTNCHFMEFAEYIKSIMQMLKVLTQCEDRNLLASVPVQKKNTINFGRRL